MELYKGWHQNIDSEAALLVPVRAAHMWWVGIDVIQPLFICINGIQDNIANCHSLTKFACTLLIFYSHGNCVVSRSRARTRQCTDHFCFCLLHFCTIYLFQRFLFVLSFQISVQSQTFLYYSLSFVISNDWFHSYSEVVDTAGIHQSNNSLIVNWMIL